MHLRSQLVDRDELGSAERLLRSIPNSSHLRWQRRLSYPLLTPAGIWEDTPGSSRLAVLAIAQMGPRDPETGQTLGGDEIRALLEEKSVGDIFVDVEGRLKSPVALRVLVTGFDKVAKLPSASPDILRSHGIDEEAALALGRGDFETFAVRRAAVLDEVFKRYFTGRLGLDDGDRPPVDELIRRVEEVLAAE